MLGKLSSAPLGIILAKNMATHNLSSKVFNYDIEHLKDILKSDVYRYKDNDEIEAAAKEHLYNMDQLLGG